MFLQRPVNWFNMIEKGLGYMISGKRIPRRIGKVSIGHDTARECDQEHEKKEAGPSHKLFLLRHNLVPDL